MGDGVADNWGQGTARSSYVCLALGKKVIKCGDKVNHPAMCIVSQPSDSSVNSQARTSDVQIYDV